MFLLQTIESTMRLLRGVFKNIVKHASSGHLKYRKLRLANASVHQSIVCVPGVLDVLQVCYPRVRVYSIFP